LHEKLSAKRTPIINAHAREDFASGDIMRGYDKERWTMLRKKEMTDAVTKALRKRLQSPRAKASVAELRAIGKRAAAHLKRPYLNHAELLYDDNGLPK
jgi:antitoxin VapB